MKVIDKLTVELNEKGGFYQVEFINLGLKKVPIEVDFVKRYPKLLVGGIWVITDVEYGLPTDPKASPWQIASVKPIQMDVLMQSVGPGGRSPLSPAGAGGSRPAGAHGRASPGREGTAGESPRSPARA